MKREEFNNADAQFAEKSQEYGRSIIILKI